MNRRKILGRAPRTCQADASRMMLGVWLLGLMTASRIIKAGGDPKEASMAQARATARRAMRRSRRGRRSEAARRKGRRGAPARRRPSERRPDFSRELAEAREDRYQRRGIKTARDYPRKKPPGSPRIRSAIPAEVKKSAGLPPPNISLKWMAYVAPGLGIEEIEAKKAARRALRRDGPLQPVTTRTSRPVCCD